MSDRQIQLERKDDLIVLRVPVDPAMVAMADDGMRATLLATVDIPQFRDAVHKIFPSGEGYSLPPALAREQGPGFLLVGMTEDNKVAVQFNNPDWFVHFTPDEARSLATLLQKKASEIDEYLQGG